MPSIRRVARAGLPTSHGAFELFVYEGPDGKEHVALVTGFEPGSLRGDEPVLVRLHSECLTGDVFGSRRCDCGEQLRESMRLLREQERGVLLYLRQEGRGVGLANKISAYALQDGGLDTVQANLALGLPEDDRDYGVAAGMLLDLGVCRAAVLTNNPAKVEGLRSHGVEVVERLPVQVAPNPSNAGYLRTKSEKLGHLFASSLSPDERSAGGSVEGASVGEERHPSANGKAQTRPTVTVSYAQTLDGRVATATGESQWISCPDSLRFAHEMRATHDAVVVGAGTVTRDDPRLTVRHVPGQDPLRVVVDSTLRTPPGAAVLRDGAAPGTVFAGTDRARAQSRERLLASGATVMRLPNDLDGRVDLGSLLDELRAIGIGSVMVEGGATLITAFFKAGLVDRLAVCVAPKILGDGLPAVGDLGIRDLSRSLTLADAAVEPYGVDLVLSGRVVYPDGGLDRG